MLAVLLPQYSLPTVLGTLIGIVAACWSNQTAGHWLRATVRLKWLFISIVVLYGWFTPGLPLFEVAGVNMPTREGLEQALFRVLLLSALVAAVMWLVKPLSAGVLSQSLSRLLRPFKMFGVDIDSLSTRLALTLAAVSGIQVLLSKNKESGWLPAAGAAIQIIEAGELQSVDHDDAAPPLRVPMWRDGVVLAGLLVIFSAPLLFKVNF